MTYKCRNCDTHRVLITGAWQSMRGRPLYEVRCCECGHRAWTSHPDITTRWAQREAEVLNAERQVNPPLVWPATNDILAEMVIRVLKKTAPTIFPEYTDMIACREDVKRAQERLDHATAQWQALGANPKKVKA